MNQYEISEKICEGNNADVYLIKSKIDNRKVYAAKKIRKKICLLYNFIKYEKKLYF